VPATFAADEDELFAETDEDDPTVESDEEDRYMSYGKTVQVES
jgi:hypothetical protein